MSAQAMNKRRTLAGKRERRQVLIGMAYIAPSFILMMIFNVIPIFVSLFLAFCKYNMVGTPTWIGLENFQKLFANKALREAIAKTVVEILGEKSNIMYILETEDRKTGLKDGSATAGHNFFVRGAMLKVVGDHESVGVTLTDSKGATTKLTDDQITINNPSSLTLLLPADLAEGEYTLTVTTQYGSAGHILKTPRSVSTQIWVGGKPADGGGDSESPDEI